MHINFLLDHFKTSLPPWLKEQLRPAYRRWKARQPRRINRAKLMSQNVATSSDNINNQQERHRMRWGIIGTGNIAHQFAEGLSSVPDGVLQAVGSRTADSANRFAKRFGIPNAHASYEALAVDPEVDVIYISTPHPFHKENALLCIEHGKHVLCEKPFTLNAADTQVVVDAARAKGVFLMEAMWMRYFPAVQQLHQMIADGKIGYVRMIDTTFGFAASFDEAGRLFAPELGGGALLDIGIYPVSFNWFVVGAAGIHAQPDSITTIMRPAPSGVDESSSTIMTWQNKAIIATAQMSLGLDLQNEATVYGTHGSLKLTAQFWQADTLIYTPKGKPSQTFSHPIEGNGYNYEIVEVQERIEAGKLESEIMSLDESVAIMRTMDAIRAKWGLVYPQEQA